MFKTKYVAFNLKVSSMIGNLRNMANDMHGELDNQNSQLDRILVLKLNVKLHKTPNWSGS